MRKRAVFLGVSVLGLLAAGCGEPFAVVGAGGSGAGGAALSGGTGGATISGGTGGATSSSATGTGSSSGGMMGADCSPTMPSTCGAGLHCATMDCVSGKCAPLPASQGAAWSPVCDCKGMLYWNADVAVASDVSFLPIAKCDSHKFIGCNKDSHNCSHAMNEYCDRDTTLQGAAACLDPDTAVGACMKLPPSCTGTNKAGAECPATSHSCSSVCTLIQSELAWNPLCTGGGG